MSRSRLDERRARGTVDVVFVTGASRGIGLEVCRQFARLGARVGMISRDAAALEAACAELDGVACAASADVSELAGLTRALRHLETTLGPPTVLVNNAGHGHWGAVVDTDPATFRRAIEVNYLGAVHATGFVLPGMMQRGRGNIVNIASIAGRIGAPFEAAYSASKFALVGYTEALAVEIAGTGVSVSLIDPGRVDTAFFERRGEPASPQGPRLIPPARIADAVLAAVLHDRTEQFVPRWLRLAYVVKTGVPVAHRVGTRRMFAAGRRALRERPH